MPSESKILFHWKAPASDFAQRLIVAVITSVSIHGLCFYVFQIQDPQPARTLPRTYGVTYLSPSDPAASLILRQLDDYYTADAGTLLADTELNVTLDALDYEPAYAQWIPELMPLPQRADPPLPALGPRGSAMVLPPIPPWEPPLPDAKAAPTAGGGGIVLAPGLQLFLPEDWRARYRGRGTTDWTAIKAQFAAAGREKWRLSVQPSGSVDRAEPLAPQTNRAVAGLEEALKNLVFSPDAKQDSDEPVWVEVDLQW